MADITVNQTTVDVDVRVVETNQEVNVIVTSPPVQDVDVRVTHEGSNVVTSQSGSDGTANLYLNSLRFNTAPTGTFSSPGTFFWDDQEGTLDLILKGGAVNIPLGQKNVIRVVNKTGADLLQADYKVVRIRKYSEGGAEGQRLAVVLAQGSTEMASTDVIGVVTETIAKNQSGFVTTFGTVTGLNTTGSLVGETWYDGDILFLSPTNPGRLTTVKPSAPNHLVIVGYVQYKHPTQGKIFVKTETAYELDELHNVKLTSPQEGEFLRYNDTTNLWENQSFTVVLDPGTATGLTGFLVGDGTELSAVIGTQDADPETVVLRDSLGGSEFLYVQFLGTSSGAMRIGAAAVTTNYDFILPVDGGSVGQVLITDGTGVTSWGYSELSASTPTILEGYIYGNGTNVAGATLASVDAYSDTIVLRDSSGSSSFQSLTVLVSASVGGNSLSATPTTGAFLLFNASSPYAIAISSPVTTANRNIEFPDNDGIVSLEGHTHVANDITDMHRLFVQSTAPTVSAGTPYVWFDTSGGDLQVLYDDGL